MELPEKDEDIEQKHIRKLIHKEDKYTVNHIKKNPNMKDTRESQRETSAAKIEPRHKMS